MSETVHNDTIFALSSAAGKAGVAIIRVSGPQAWESARLLTGRAIEGRKAHSLTLRHPVSGEIIDRALVIGFQAPASFTGEDVVEYHCHGSLAVIEEMMAVLGEQDGLRPAGHGEFTRRAFDNGKLDLTEAEAVADLIDAETKAQKDQALAQMGGALSALYHQWAEELTRALAYVEAVIDFPDEEVPDEETAKAKPAVEKLCREIENHLDDKRRGERLRDGIQVVVIGTPNAGKSSLVNLLSGREVAIVSSMAGTTRDIIEAHLNLGGYPVILADTAGLRPEQINDGGHGAIESEGIRRALKRAEEADIKLLLFDGTEHKPDVATMEQVDDRSIVVVNKIDKNPAAREKFHVKQGAVFISVKSQEGLESLLDVLTQKIGTFFSSARESPSLTRQRHRSQLEECLMYLEKALIQKQPELIAQELRFALSALGRITGRVDVEDLLDVIFKDFCIGK